MSSFPVVVVFGPLGVGKSALFSMIDRLFETPDVWTTAEPSHAVLGSPLQTLYRQDDKSGGAVQLMILMHRIVQHMRVLADARCKPLPGVVMLDGHPYTDRLIYNNWLLASGRLMSTKQRSQYDNTLNMHADHVLNPCVYVHLTCDPQILLRRIRRRARPEERELTREAIEDHACASKNAADRLRADGHEVLTLDNTFLSVHQTAVRLFDLWRTSSAFQQSPFAQKRQASTNTFCRFRRLHSI